MKGGCIGVLSRREILHILLREKRGFCGVIYVLLCNVMGLGPIRSFFWLKKTDFGLSDSKLVITMYPNVRQQVYSLLYRYLQSTPYSG